WPRATPRAPGLNGSLLYSDGMVAPPVPLPSGSPPWITQASTRWKVRPLKYPELAFCSKLAMVLLTPASGSVCNLATMRPLLVSRTMYLPLAALAGVAPPACGVPATEGGATVLADWMAVTSVG